MMAYPNQIGTGATPTIPGIIAGLGTQPGGTNGGGGAGTGGVLPGNANYTPDFMSLILNDPSYAAALGSYNAAGTSEAAQRAAATNQALIGYGAIPDLAAAGAQLGLSPAAIAMLQADIDPNASALANANTGAGLSTEAQLAHQQDMAMMALRNNLAARGALSSGDDAYRTNEQSLAYSKAQQDALNALLGAIGGYQNTYLNARNSDTGTLNSAMQTAEQLQASLPQNQGFSLHYDPKTGTYTDAAGTIYTPHYNGDGTWTLTNSASGSGYTLAADGTLSPYTPPTGTAGTPSAGTGTGGTGTGTGGTGTGTGTGTTGGGLGTGGGTTGGTNGTTPGLTGGGGNPNPPPQTQGGGLHPPHQPVYLGPPINPPPFPGPMTHIGTQPYLGTISPVQVGQPISMNLPRPAPLPTPAI